MKDCLKKIDEILDLEQDPAYKRRARIIFENLDLKGNEKVLEVGCGRGFYLKTLKSVWPDLEVTGIDLNQKYLDKAKEFLGSLDVRLVKGDATKLPFKDKTFDRIIASEILEHIPDDQKAVSEMYRVLKPGGIVMVTVPNKNYPFCWDPVNWILERLFKWHLPSNIWWLSSIWADHVRLYNERELRDKVEKPASVPPQAGLRRGKKGFKVEKIWRATHYCLPFSHFLFYGIGKNLVEKGFFPSMNRFGQTRNDTLFKTIVLWPIRKIDKLDDSDHKGESSVNLIFRIRKV